MPKYTSKLILYFTIFSFLFIVGTGYWLLTVMSSSLKQEQEKQFQLVATSKANIINNYIDDLYNNFKTYAQLPSFQSIRFYRLTLNQLAVKESVRQLELFFFDLIKNNQLIVDIKYIDEVGTLTLHVDQKNIYEDPTNLSFTSFDSSVLNKNLLPKQYYIETLNKQSGKLTWWLPVYVSTQKRMGYLGFTISTKELNVLVSELSDNQLNTMSIYNEQKQLILGNNISFDEQWQFSQPLSLNDIQWEIRIHGNQKAYTQSITLINKIVNYGFLPIASVILLLLIYFLHKKVQSEIIINRLAYHDNLTGLFNRHHFEIKFNELVRYYNRYPENQGVLILLDLDHFKPVNDNYGHQVGDLVLKHVANLFLANVRNVDIVARIGGDEFAIIIQKVTHENKIIPIVEKLIEATSETIVIKENKINIGCSIGISFINSDVNLDTEEYLKCADIALYQAKALG
ncbi:MAG: GGDEF domain-containing protein, partial [Gammaproteobacteria bacterium]|nr:GGDEF domain-containing protein [Gammaproteobacteria bacterium]